MAIQVKLVEGEELSPQEQERKIVEGETPEENQPQPVELTDELVLEHLNKKYEGRSISALDDLFKEKEPEPAPEVPEDIKVFMKFREETGRGFADFVELNREYDKLPDNVLVEKYLLDTEEGLDKSDIASMLKKYEYDADMDDETEVAEKKIEMKRLVAKAKNHFDERKEKYKAPIEGYDPAQAQPQAPQQNEQQQAEAEENAKRSEWFEKKTDEFFSDTFESFKAKVGDYDVEFKFGGPTEMKKANATPWNFVKDYLDEKGFLKDPEGYHTALAVAMNWKRFAEMMIEHGKALQAEEIERADKNINMSARPRPQNLGAGGLSVKAVKSSDGYETSGLKVRGSKK